MSDQTSIEWTDATWNPVTGCQKISPGCKNCYAARLAPRLQAMGNPRYSNGFAINLHHDLIDLPKKWKKPRKVFVNSMSDLFHEEVPLEFIQLVFNTIENTGRHTFQLLTKRPERALEVADQLTWPANLWMGVSVENSDYAHRHRYPPPHTGTYAIPIFGASDRRHHENRPDRHRLGNRRG